MKRNFRWLMLLCATLWAGVVISCEEPKPTPQPDPQEPSQSEYPEAKVVNTYVVNGEEFALGSVATMMEGENLIIVATPASGVSGAEAIFASSEYIFGAVSPLLVGETFDVMSEQSLFTISSTLVGVAIDTIAPEFLEEVTKGQVTISNNDGKVSMVAGLVLADGTKLAVNMECEARGEIVINENVITRAGEEKPIRSVFYNEENGLVSLYVSPAGLDHAGELENSTYYTYIEIPVEMLGSSVEVESLPANTRVSFGLEDNYDPSQSFVIYGASWAEVYGECFVEQVESNLWRIMVQLTIGGEEYAIAFEGECVDYNYRPEEKNNFLTYGKGNKKQEIGLVGATLDRSTDVWVVTLTAADDSVLTATVPAACFEVEVVGFSQYPNDLSVTYNNRTYSKPNGDSGTIKASFTEGNTPQLDFEFIGYDDLSCIYSGDCTVVE